MPTFKFQKLCRDNVEKLLREKGLTVFSCSLEKEAYLKALKKKVLEEANEIEQAQTLEELQEEIADLQEVLGCLINASGLAQADITETGKQKRETDGSFEERLYIEEILVPEGHPYLEYYRCRPEKYLELKLQDNFNSI